MNVYGWKNASIDDEVIESTKVCEELSVLIGIPGPCVPMTNLFPLLSIPSFAVRSLWQSCNVLKKDRAKGNHHNESVRCL